MRQHNKSGYTIIEVTIVLTLIILLAALSIPSINFMRQQSVLLELNKLHNVFTHLQRNAMSSNQTQSLIFDYNLRSYTYHGHSEKLPDNIMFNTITNIPSLSGKGSAKSAVTFPNQRVLFYPSGNISAGTAYISNKHKKRACALTVPISHISLVRKYEFKNRKWILLN